MQFRLLGPVEVEATGKVILLPRRRERCLLGVLLLNLNRVVSADRLAELLWDGDPPERARRTLHGHVSRLRAALVAGGAGAGDAGASDAGASGARARLATVGDGYRMEADPQAVDAHRFRALLDQAAQATDPAHRADQLRTALDLWRGRALNNAASDWLRDRLCADLVELRLTATEDLMAADLSLHRERQILPELARLAHAHPSRDNLVALHMRALYQAGRKTDALEVYARARTRLADELGLDPSPVLRELHQAILRDQVTVPVAPAPAPAAAPAPAGLVVVPRQLPPDMTGFIGRTAYVDQLDALVPGAGDTTAPVVISALRGTAGIGKTALAVHWAHRVAGRFPDGQLYLNLRGFDPSGVPVTPAEAVRALLEALRVPTERLPSSLDAQVGLYRSLLAGRRVLVLLDNARDSEQVRPLLPGTSGCLALVTSRNHLSSLVVAEGARPLTLDLLSPEEAAELLGRRLGADRIAAEPDAVAEITARCDGLPLALAIVAARAAGRPRLRLVTLADELREAGPVLDAMADSGAVTDLRTVFSWSYQALTARAARLFRLLGQHPGPTISIPAAASLAGTGAAPVRRLLTELTRSHLIIESEPGRYSFHDLLRSYAIELAGAIDPAGHGHAALRQLLDYYLQTSLPAALMISPYRSPIAALPARPDVAPDPITDDEQAASWFAAEHEVLVAAIAEANRAGLAAHCWQLAWTLAAFLGNRGRWHDQLATQQAALDAAGRSGDQTGLAHAHRLLGNAHLRLGNESDAQHHLRESADRFHTLGDHIGVAESHAALGMMRAGRGEHPEAIDHARQALDHYRRAGNRIGEAFALNNLGFSYGLSGDYQRCLRYCQQAVKLHEETGNSRAQAATWDTLGYAHHHLGAHPQAISCYQRALDLYQQAGDLFNQAEVLTHLGDTHHTVGEPETARAAWRRSLAIFEKLEVPDAAEVRARIDRLAVTGGDSAAG